MKLIAFLGGGLERLGWIQDDQTSILVVDSSFPNVPGTVLEVIIGGDAALDATPAAAGQMIQKPLADVDLLPPLTKPDGIFCVGLNYVEHAREAPVAGTDYPAIFLRLARNQVADKQPLQPCNPCCAMIMCMCATTD